MKSWVALTVLYGTSRAYGLEFADTSLVSQHRFTIAELDCATTYYYRVVSRDANGVTAISADNNFTTSACPEPPFAITDLAVSVGQTSAQVSWTTTRTATGRVDYGVGSALNLNVSVNGQSLDHAFTLAHLDCGTTYSYRVEAQRVDAFANTPTRQFTTVACDVSI